MMILDTDVLTLVQIEAGEEYETLAARLDAASEIPHVTIVSFEEQMRGWLAYIASRRTEEQRTHAYQRLRALLDDFQTRPVLD
jgi:tRNA(fMet)-specific endonuclease VapC